MNRFYGKFGTHQNACSILKLDGVNAGCPIYWNRIRMT